MIGTILIILLVFWLLGALPSHFGNPPPGPDQQGVPAQPRTYCRWYGAGPYWGGGGGGLLILILILVLLFG